jgi:hypothetical protein
MLQTPTPPSESDDPAGGLTRVQRLATELASRMRYAQIVARPIPQEQVAALVAAARLLHEKGEPWPALVGEVLQHVADDLSEEPTPGPAPEGESEGEGNRVVAGLARFLGGFRREPPREP